MSALAYVKGTVLPAMVKLLPENMASRESRAMLIAIGLQESRFEYRFQVGGPAHGFWQFEYGGAWLGLVRHPATKVIARQLLLDMAYGEPDIGDYKGIAHNDILSCCLARLLLYTLPAPLPQRDDVDEGWRQYIEGWRPGKPHPETWAGFYAQAWSVA